MSFAFAATLFAVDKTYEVLPCQRLTTIFFLSITKTKETKSHKMTSSDLENQPNEPPIGDVEETESHHHHHDHLSSVGRTSSILQSKEKNRPRCQLCTAPRCCLIFCILFCLMIAGSLIWYFFIFTQNETDPIASCGNCHCIVSNNETCPTISSSSSSSSDDGYKEHEIETWLSQTVNNVIRLKCNPYESDDCKTTPEQDEGLYNLGETAVCAVHYDVQFVVKNNTDVDNNNQTTTTATEQLVCDNASYQLVSYPSMAEAEAAGGYVTHVGQCGVCSTLQDLAVYIQHQDLTTIGKFCAEQGSITSFESGRDCYRALGMSSDCSAIWAYSSWNIATECFSECLFDEGLFFANDIPNNGPAPECKLNDCLQCAETIARTKFERYAGRTRERSGLLSAVARPCKDSSGTSILQRQITCPETIPL